MVWFLSLTGDRFSKKFAYEGAGSVAWGETGGIERTQKRASGQGNAVLLR